MPQIMESHAWQLHPARSFRELRPEGIRIPRGASSTEHEGLIRSPNAKDIEAVLLFTTVLPQPLDSEPRQLDRAARAARRRFRHFR